MIKKIIFIIIFVLFLTGCTFFNQTFDLPERVTNEWQTIAITGLGTFRVPMEWNVEEHDDILYITDKPMLYGNYTIYMVGASLNRVDFPLHELFEGVERGDILRSIASGTRPAYIYFVEYSVNGTNQVHYEIRFTHSQRDGSVYYILFIWNRDVVDEWHIKQIARTFLTARGDFDNENAGRLE